MKIANAKDIPLNQNSGTVPNVSGAMLEWFQAMIFGVVTKTEGKDTGFQAVETVVNVSFQGVIQPFTDRQLLLKPEGERAWTWLWLHADPTLNLQVDSVINYLTVQYRVASRKDFTLYGYVEYHLVEDYTGAGPT